MMVERSPHGVFTLHDMVGLDRSYTLAVFPTILPHLVVLHTLFYSFTFSSVRSTTVVVLIIPILHITLCRSVSSLIPTFGPHTGICTTFPDVVPVHYTCSFHTPVTHMLIWWVDSRLVIPPPQVHVPL